MKIKKTLLLLALSVSLLVFGACNNENKDVEEKKEENKTEVKEKMENKDSEQKESDEKDSEQKEESNEADKTQTTEEGASVGDLAIDFELKSFTEDKMYKLSDYRGKNPVIVKFFASWCGPCHQEMPSLNEINQEYSEKGLIVLAVNVGGNDNEKDVKALIDDYVLSFPVLQDWESDTAIKYLVRGIPVNVFINKEGVITAYKTGMQTKEQYVEEVEKIIQ